MRTLAVIGATLTGNKGAASMLIALSQNIGESGILINALSIYGKKDERFNFYSNLKIIKCSPFDIICIAMPLAFLFFCFRRLPLIKKLILKNRVLSTIYNADLTVNIAGISYSDGRGLILLYNVACDATPLLLGKRVFKYSQAIGPFNGLFNRLCAKAILPRVSIIAARGVITAGNLQHLGLCNYELCADAAFSMSVNQANIRREVLDIRNRLHVEAGIKIGVAPSSVIEEYCSEVNKPYVDILSDAINNFSGSLVNPVMLFAYCALNGSSSVKNNDLLVLDEIYRSIRNKEQVIYCPDEYSAEELKYLISGCDVLITSRYHAMVTALANGVVPLVIGWSHKYLETLKQFGFEQLCLDYSGLTGDRLKDKFKDITTNIELYRQKIRLKFPEVRNSSLRNFSIIREMLGDEVYAARETG